MSQSFDLVLANGTVVTPNGTGTTTSASRRGASPPSATARPAHGR